MRVPTDQEIFDVLCNPEVTKPPELRDPWFELSDEEFAKGVYKFLEEMEKVK